MHVVFGIDGVYSRRLQAMLEDYGYRYVIINPLKAKKEMDLGLRRNKTDKADAYHLAMIQRLYKHPVNQVQSRIYNQLASMSHFYDQLTSDNVKAIADWLKALKGVSSKRAQSAAEKLLYRAIGQIDNASKTSPCHIADYYESKKRSLQTKGFKKIAIASISRLLRTIYALIVNDQTYDYDVAKRNQKRL